MTKSQRGIDDLASNVSSGGIQTRSPSKRGPLAKSAEGSCPHSDGLKLDQGVLGNYYRFCFLI